jgi:hypothetical protein
MLGRRAIQGRKKFPRRKEKASRVSPQEILKLIA